jgi:predicted ATPase with chaperone activity
MPDGVTPIKIAVVGLPDTAVKESKDRVASAICNSPQKKAQEMLT